MKSNLFIQFSIGLLVIVAVVLPFANPAQAKSEVVTLVGEINDTGQLVAEGDLFDIEQTAAGDDLVQNYISMKVKVEGTVREGEELKIITVKSFQVVDE